jgi:ABC-type multidrug transport system fused ATPase/permease subunit
MPQITTCIEAMAAARSAAYPALEAMYRDADLNEGKGNASAAEGKQEALQRRGSAVSLPKYAIDSSSPKGLKPEVVKGHIRFHNVSFCYPSRLESLVFNGFNLDVPEGKTVALIGTR